MLGEVEAESENGEGESARPGHGFDQEAGKLPIFMQKIVGPFQGGFETGQGTDGIRGGEGTQEGEDRELVSFRFQHDRTPEAQGAIGDPAVSLAAAAGCLDLGSPGGRDVL